MPSSINAAAGRASDAPERVAGADAGTESHLLDVRQAVVRAIRRIMLLYDLPSLHVLDKLMLFVLREGGPQGALLLAHDVLTSALQAPAAVQAVAGRSFIHARVITHRSVQVPLTTDTCAPAVARIVVEALPRTERGVDLAIPVAFRRRDALGLGLAAGLQSAAQVAQDIQHQLGFWAPATSTAWAASISAEGRLASSANVVIEPGSESQHRANEQFAHWLGLGFATITVLAESLDPLVLLRAHLASTRAGSTLNLAAEADVEQSSAGLPAMPLRAKSSTIAEAVEDLAITWLRLTSTVISHAVLHMPDAISTLTDHFTSILAVPSVYAWLATSERNSVRRASQRQVKVLTLIFEAAASTRTRRLASESSIACVFRQVCASLRKSSSVSHSKYADVDEDDAPPSSARRDSVGMLSDVATERHR
ncbi:MAG: hypothetical protein EOO65_05115, partial [Methanosarcinales archaeon]